VSLFVRLDQPGVELVDDWDGFGQKLTGTGTTRFEGAQVEGESIRERTERVGYLSALFQLALLAVVAGVARRASRDVAGQVARRTRVYGSGNADLARDDVQIQQVVGELSAAAYAAHSLVTGLAGVVEEALAQARSGDAELATDAARVVDYDVYRVQVVLADLVPTALSRGFGALGSSAVRVSAALDRHWRNARTVLSHNPVVYRAKLIGDLEINGRVPESVAGIGVAPSTLAALRDAETASATHTQEHA
jgi:alkylation response protein AidB-like acyl-CoA dehydrogenase